MARIDQRGESHFLSLPSRFEWLAGIRILMSSPTHILTVLTPDRRGIIAAVTEVLDRHGIQLQELSQTVVRDYFTVILVLRLDERTAEETVAVEIETALATGATVTLVPYRAGAAQPAPGERYILTATGTTSAGIVNTIAEIIANRGGNFSDLSSRSDDGAIRIIAEIDLPTGVPLEQLQIDLEHAGAEAGLQVRLQHHRLFVATNEVAFRRYHR